MKIAVVLAPWYRRESPSPDVAMAVALLRSAGHEVSVFDANNLLFSRQFKTRDYWKYFIVNYDQRTADEFYGLTAGFFDRFAEEILGREPEAVVFKIAAHTYDNAARLAACIRRKSPGTRLIFSGLVPPDSVLGLTWTADGLLTGKLPFDGAVRGEDELLLPAALAAAAEGRDYFASWPAGIVTCGPDQAVADLDSLPFFDFTVFDLEAYKCPDTLELFMSRGCPWRCAFCDLLATERHFRVMSGRRIYEEVCHQARCHPALKRIRFCDKTINGDPAALAGFAGLMAGAGAPVSWSGDGMIRPEMDCQLLETMRRGGCGGIGYGVESGSDAVLRAMGKRFTAALAGEVLRQTHEAGIHTDINILVGFPAETREDFGKTLDFIGENRRWIDEIRISHMGCIASPGAALGRFPERFGIAAEGGRADPESWVTRDGGNTPAEREERYDILTKYILDAGIPLRVNSRMTRTGKAAVDSSLPDQGNAVNGGKDGQ